MNAPSLAYRRLALGTIGATFVLIVLGGVVRVSDSGLGCGPGGSGLHGWPFCRGNVIPGVSLHTWIEYAHRTVASLVAILMIVLAVQAWRKYRTHRGIVKAAVAAALLVVAQGLLGALTVEHDLNEGLVAAHLGIAMLLLALTIYIWRASRPEVIGAEPVPAGSRLRALLVTSQVLVLCTIVAGGYMAGTQHYGRPDYQLGDGAHHACGTQFPGCNGSFMPYGSSRLVDIHLVHRTFMYLTVIALLALVVVVVRSHPPRPVARLAYGIVGVLVLQVLVGALNVWIANEYETLILLHLTLGTLLWGVVTGLTLQFVRVPEPSPEPARPRLEAATA
ncbi:MAG: COX15/CtaA family protein [Thermoleophilaceae bacterium]